MSDSEDEGTLITRFGLESPSMREDRLASILATIEDPGIKKRPLPELIRLRNEKRAEEMRKHREEQERAYKEHQDKRRKALELKRQKVIEHRRNLLQKSLIPEDILREEEEKEKAEMRARVESESETESETESESETDYETESESETESEYENEDTVKPFTLRGLELWKDSDGYLWSREGTKGIGDFQGKLMPKLNKIDDSMEEPYELSFE